MKILISGSSGLIGSELQNFLKNQGHQIMRLVRKNRKEDNEDIFWDPNNNVLDSKHIENLDAIVNLSGENISGRWDEKKKQRILTSRIESTKTLVNAIRKLKNPPKVFVSASAIGIYGDRGPILCNEDSNLGTGFLADVCRQWEESTNAVAEKGVRTVNLRFGVVLSPKGGALKKMLFPFRMGLGGILGDGQQYFSWISIDDVMSIILFTLSNMSLSGPVNAVSPDSVTNEEFTKVLGNVLKRPTLFNIPAWVLRLIFGNEMSDEIFLSSTRVQPLKLIQAGYPFHYPELENALKHLLT